MISFFSLRNYQAKQNKSVVFTKHLKSWLSGLDPETEALLTCFLGSIPDRAITPSRIRSSEPHPGFLFNHDPFGIAQVAGLCQRVSTSS